MKAATCGSALSAASSAGRSLYGTSPMPVGVGVRVRVRARTSRVGVGVGLGFGLELGLGVAFELKLGVTGQEGAEALAARGV